MRTLTLSIASRDEVSRRALAAFEGTDQGSYVSFASVDLLWKVMSPKRWDLLKTMAGQEAMTIREAARRSSRDVKAVHGDVHALLDAGILERGADGRVSFPYDAIHVDFTLTQAA
ncbi:transcriptional regulator [Paramagnetospirillum kuznetsovii]|uniref:Transcriptional regulator n=1 Tax=Paramagnetospirillum kuznetsovii TaxID=2053833 RepID=A0A364P2T2_9PROT|nr:transcriptional regulator [Paramagnetospirillum kuznetsovii]RAU23395.1 transcriptional regulator [Paramagnetospirillum kuznetsovii]